MEKGDENVTINNLGKLCKEFVKHGIIKDDVEVYAVIKFLKENI